jgi:hypothetical protein
MASQGVILITYLLHFMLAGLKPVGLTAADPKSGSETEKEKNHLIHESLQGDAVDNAKVPEAGRAEAGSLYKVMQLTMQRSLKLAALRPDHFTRPCS